MEVSEAILKRRSIRKFTDQKVTDEQIDLLLKSAMAAPSACNKRPWFFYVIKNPEKTSSGGFKDFCVQSLKIPSITIEVGSDNLSHPIGEEFLGEIYEKNKFIANDLVFAYDICKKYGINN